MNPGGASVASPDRFRHIPILPEVCMRARFIAIPVIAVAALAGGTVVATAAPAGVPSTVQVLTIVPNAPFALRQGGKLTGLDVQMANAIATAVGIKKLEWRPTLFDQLIGKVASGAAPMAASSITITPARAKQLIFSKPYLQANLAVVTQKGSGVAQGGNLGNLRVGALKGSTSITYLAAQPNVTDIAFPTQQASFKALLRGQIDAVVGDYAQSSWYVQHNASAFSLVATLPGTGQLAYAFTKTQTALRDAFNSGLAIIKRNGTYARLVEKWIP